MAAGQEALRVVAPDEALHGERLWELMDCVFGEGAGAACRDGRIAHSHYDWQTSRIGLVGDRVVTHFGVYDLSMRVGSASVRTAGVNLVGTHPDFRRRGYMDAVTRASLEAMRENGYALSLICNGEPNLYGRHGYLFAWPQSAWTVKTENLPADTAVAERLEGLDIGEFTPGGRPELWELYNRWHEGVSGTAVRPTFRRSKTPNSPDRGYRASDAGGSVVAYLVADVTQDGKTFWIDDAAGDPGVLLAMFSRLARENGCEEVKVTRQPLRGPLMRQVRRLTAREENLYAADGRWMVRVIDPVLLLKTTEPELTCRLRRSAFADWNGRITLSDGKERTTLRVERGRVAAEGGVVQAVGQLAIGALPPEEVLDGLQVTSEREGAEELLVALFQYQQPMMSNGDI